MKSALCSVARLTVTPPTKTGVSIAVGVSLPLRPTVIMMSSNLGDGRLGREFVGDGPARGTAGVAEALLRCVRIHLEHHAVDLVAKRGAIVARRRQ